MNISMTKRYTLEGKDFTILTVTKPGRFPVLGHTLDGIAYEFKANKIGDVGSLVEVSPCAAFVIDEPVMVRDYDTEYWARQYFAGMSKDCPTTWWGSGTKWSAGPTATVVWLQCRRPTAEELAT